MKRFLKSLALGVPILLIYMFISGALLIYYADGDINRIRTAPPFDIATRLPTVMLRYLFPEKISNFYKPGFTSEKILLATCSFLVNALIFSIPPYVFFWCRDRSKKSNSEQAEAPPPPPSFDS